MSIEGGLHVGAEDAVGGVPVLAMSGLVSTTEPSFLSRGSSIWDERSTIHQVVNDHFPQRRTVHRCVVDGDRPFFDLKQTATA